MIVNVRLFARARELARADAVAVNLPAGATVAELRRQLATCYPALAGLVGQSAVAVNDEFAADVLQLHAPIEIALLPPVSGG